MKRTKKGTKKNSNKKCPRCRKPKDAHVPICQDCLADLTLTVYERE